MLHKRIQKHTNGQKLNVACTLRIPVKLRRGVFFKSEPSISRSTNFHNTEILCLRLEGAHLWLQGPVI